MRSVTVRTADLKNIIINLGFVGENEHRQIRFDAKKDFEEYPNASASLTVVPPEGESYPAIIERDGDFVLWTITDSDVIGEGDGEIQLAFTEGEVVKRTCIGRTKTDRSLVPTGSIPSGIDDFITRAGAALTAIPETIDEALAEAKASGEFDGPPGEPGQDGYSPTATVSKSGKTATITITDKNGTTTAQISDGEGGGGGTSDYEALENLPQIGGVTLKGNKSLHDLGAAAESDIPDPTSIIDDTAGSGDTSKVWSADKSSALLTEINSKQDAPSAAGTAGQALVLDNNLHPVWGDVAIDPEDIAEAVDDWLDDHPEATTTVEDGSITEAKLSDELAETIANKASAIVNSMSGGSITFDDNIPNTKLKDCKVIIDSESGVTGGKVFLYGKNLLNPALKGYSSTGSEQVWGMTSGYADGRIVLPAGYYTLSISGLTSGITRWKIVGTDGSAIANSYSGSSLTFELSAKTVIGVYISVNGSTQSNIDALQNYAFLESGQNVTTYAAFSGQVVSFAFPEAAGTVYDATYDVTTGVLTVNTDPQTEYETEGHDITTVSGRNLLVASCGDIYAEYLADTTKFLSGVTKQADKATESVGNISSAVNDGYSIVEYEYVRGSRTTSTISSSTTRITSKNLINVKGEYRIILNGKKVYLIICDENGSIMKAPGWINPTYYDFCCPDGCSFAITLEKADQSTFTTEENNTVLCKKIGKIETSEENTGIINNFIKDQTKIQIRIPAEAWWNKRIDTSLTYETTGTRICNKVPFELTTGQIITVVCTNSSQEFDFYTYTVSGDVKTLKEHTGWRNADYVYEVSENCYCVINVRYANDSSIVTIDNSVVVFKNVSGDGNTLPDYWKTYLDQQIPTIKGNIHDVGNTGDTFMLVTDTHWENNRRNSPAVMKYLKDKTNISFAVNCGDLIQGVATASGALDLLEDYQSKIKGIEPFYCVRGNHDTNMDGDYSTGEITEGQWYAIIDKPLEKVVDTGKHAYFYKDNVSQKIRYIFMDFTNVMTWFASAVASTPSGYSIVVFTHYLFTPEAATHTGDLEVSPFGQNLINAIDSNKPNDVGVIGIFGGHVHRDFNTTATNGYLLVGTTCDANAAGYFDPVTPSRTAGTTGEQVIDVISINTYAKTVKMHRIGAGASRTLSYT